MFEGKRFASPIKQGPREKRSKLREETRFLSLPSSSDTNTATSSTVLSTPLQPSLVATAEEHLPNSTVANEVRPSLDDSDTVVNDSDTNADTTGGTDPVVYAALLARIELLQAENLKLSAQQEASNGYFRIEDIQNDDKLVCFYTGFTSFRIFLAFFEFLGPAKDRLNYWGEKPGPRKRNRSRKLDTKNQLFLTLVKLRLNLKLKDMSFRFGLSTAQVSRYITTWICFLYHHLKEIDWMPSVDQVWATIPTAFKEKFPTTFAIIDGSEVFIETPSDLHMQSSTWSQYKHHNTVKFLVACNPNGAICFISPVFVGSISDVELTKLSGFLDKLEDKPGISIMADRGFTIKDLLSRLNIELNIPPFLNEQKQLPSTKVDAGRKIASLRIHIERAISRIKTYTILKQTIPISLARLTNQIVYVCAFLTNFQPALVTFPTGYGESDVEDYFQTLTDDSDLDSDES